MRISDWSSDVCSSDLAQFEGSAAGNQERPVRLPLSESARPTRRRTVQDACREQGSRRRRPHDPVDGARQEPDRSEEHTSELQSLMRISSAVFCLKKKTTTTQIPASNTSYEKEQNRHTRINKSKQKPGTTHNKQN